MTSLLVRVGYSVSDSGRTADVSRVKSLHVRQHVHSWRYKAIMLHHSHQSIPHRLLTSLNSLRVLRILALVVPIPSVDDLPLNIISSLPGEKFSHLLFFLRSIEIAFVKRLREKDFLCRREVQVCAFPLPPGVPASTLDTLRRPLLKGFSFTPPPGGPRSTLRRGQATWYKGQNEC